MIKNGMSCARLDLTNGDIEFHARTIRNVMAAAPGQPLLCEGEAVSDPIRRAAAPGQPLLCDEDIEFLTSLELPPAPAPLLPHVAIMVDTAGPEIFVKSGEPESYVDGWPRWGKATDVKIGQTVTITDLPDAKFSPQRWPVTYAHFAQMCKVGDHITVGRYLSTGMEGTSVTLEVTKIVDGHDVQCR